MRLGMPVSPKSKSPLIPYRFHSENKIGDVGLRVWVDYNDAVSSHVSLALSSPSHQLLTFFWSRRVPAEQQLALGVGLRLDRHGR